jgi:intracellular sulfur oxidation DsrE/DsrF family protein
MNPKFIPFLIVVAFCLLTNHSFSQQQQLQIDEVKIHNVVIQLNTADTASWSSVIGNIKNIQKVWPNNLNIEVVVHGKALDFLVKEKTYFKDEIQLLSLQGIKFNACENTMRKHNITADMLVKDAGTVPSGVAEVIMKQENGWSYLKSGL